MLADPGVGEGRGCRVDQLEDVLPFDFLVVKGLPGNSCVDLVEEPALGHLGAG